MLIPGLVSVTFRSRQPREICALCCRAGLSAVEWGADIHVPPGKAQLAREVKHLCAEHGLTIPSYGSYYRVGEPTEKLLSCLDTAKELGADTVRIWYGAKGSRDAQPERGLIVNSLVQCAAEARQHSISLSLEYHARTLTDERESVLRLMDETKDFSDCLSFYWQPRFDRTHEECMLSLQDVLPRLSHIHAFTWRGNDGKCRLPLEKGAALWKEVLSLLSAQPIDPSSNHCILLEFVQNDSPDALLHDAAFLLNCLRSTSCKKL